MNPPTVTQAVMPRLVAEARNRPPLCRTQRAADGKDQSQVVTAGIKLPRRYAPPLIQVSVLAFNRNTARLIARQINHPHAIGLFY